MKVAAFDGEDLGPLARMLSGVPNLPLAYLPGVSGTGCVALALHELKQRTGRPGADVLAAWDGTRAVGLLCLQTPGRGGASRIASSV